MLGKSRLFLQTALSVRERRFIEIPRWKMAFLCVLCIWSIQKMSSFTFVLDKYCKEHGMVKKPQK